MSHGLLKDLQARQESGKLICIGGITKVRRGRATKAMEITGLPSDTYSTTASAVTATIEGNQTSSKMLQRVVLAVRVCHA